MTAKSDRLQPNPKHLISLDIDGTMEFGDPPGRVTTKWVKHVQNQGHLVGSASDRPLSEQRRLWSDNGIDLDFIILKHWMQELKEKFEANEYWHVGDRQMDQVYATRSGFTFFWAQSFPEEMAAYDAQNFEAF